MEIFKKPGKLILTLLVLIVVISSIVFTVIKFKGNSEENKESKKEKITFCLDWTPNTNHTGLFVAQELGYFEELGLEVEFIQPPEDTATSLVAAGKAHFGIDFQDTLAPAFENDMPVTAICTILQHNSSRYSFSKRR